MRSTLYDPEVQKIGFEIGKMIEKLQNAKNLLDVLDDETIATKLNLDIEIVKTLRTKA